MYASRSPIRIISLAIVLGAVSACASDRTLSAPSEPVETVRMCRAPSAGVGSLVDVPANEVAARQAQGDYVASLVVDPTTTHAGDGIHFTRITDALDVVRALRTKRGEVTTASCTVAIDVAAGTYPGMASPTAPGVNGQFERFPIVIDMPGVALKGALVITYDSLGRASGTQGSAASTLAPKIGLGTNPIPDAVFIVEGHPNGSAGNDVSIQGFAIQSGHVGVDVDSGGYGIFSLRVNNLVIRGNRFEPTLTSAMDLRATTATVDANLVSGGQVCDICLAGPGQFTVTANKVGQGGIDGIVVSAIISLPVPAGVEQIDLPTTAAVTASVVNNEVRDHLRTPVGVAIRASAIGTGAPSVAQSTTISIVGNSLIHNTFGMLIEAGFPVANTQLKGDITASLSNNTVQSSCQSDLMVTFNRHATTLGAAQLTRPYIRNSNYTISLGGELSWDNVWYSNPDGFGNVLTVDGLTMGPGSRLAYNPTKVCN